MSNNEVITVYRGGHLRETAPLSGPAINGKFTLRSANIIVVISGHPLHGKLTLRVKNLISIISG